MQTEIIAIHIIVEVNKTDRREVTFHTDDVTGLQIKEAARVPVDSDLALKRHGKLELIPNEEAVDIHNGEHFYVLPSGTISWSCL